jgi:2-oxoisovalerate dehydrogenase E1 component
MLFGTSLIAKELKPNGLQIALLAVRNYSQLANVNSCNNSLGWLTLFIHLTPYITCMKFERKQLSNDELKSFYKALLKPRMIEEKMMLQLRSGKISKWFSAWGQEGISVGATLAMNTDEVMLPMHRNLGMFTTRNVPLHNLFAQWQGKADGFTKGRDRSFHFGTMDYNLVGMISHLGAQLGIADGIALACKLNGEQKATLVVSGDGGASEGDFHEALNVAAVWDLPVIFLIEHNQWGLSTPNTQQFKFKSFTEKGPGYGIDAVSCNGNNLLEVYHTVKEAAEKIRKEPRPILVECNSFRVRGHEEASGTKYYPEGLIEKWEMEDPVTNFEKFLLEEKVLNEADIEQIKLGFKLEINKAVDEVWNLPAIEFSQDQELNDMYAAHEHVAVEPSKSTKPLRMIDAISEGLREAMNKHDLVLMGQDIGEYGGVFKVTDGFVKDFGAERVRNTPLCESAIVGASLGLSIKKKKAMVEMQFSDFVTCGFNQIVNNLAKIHWRWGQNADVVVRMPTGAGVGAGPYHSQSTEAWFTHVPGLKVVYPAFPQEAKGLLIAAFEDPNPVLFFEHKALYRSVTEEVPEGYYNEEIGKAKVLKEGTDLTIITYGLGVHWALETLNDEKFKHVELLNLTSLAPIDYETIFASVRKTGKVLVFHEDILTGSIGGEISAQISEHCFEHLDAPVKRLTSIDTPVPFAANLENGYLPKTKLEDSLTELLGY